HAHHSLRRRAPRRADLDHGARASALAAAPRRPGNLSPRPSRLRRHDRRVPAGLASRSAHAGLPRHASHHGKGFLMGKSTTTTTEQKTVDPVAQGTINDITGEARRLYQSGAGTSLWGGPLIAPLNPVMTEGLSGLIGNARRMSGSGGAGFKMPVPSGSYPTFGAPAVGNGGVNGAPGGSAAPDP